MNSLKTNEEEKTICVFLVMNLQQISFATNHSHSSSFEQ